MGGFLLLRSGFWLVSLICDVGLGCWMRFGMSPFLFLYVIVELRDSGMYSGLLVICCSNGT